MTVHPTSRRDFLGTLGAGAAALGVPAWARREVAYVEQAVGGPSTGVVRLNFNENPYGPSPKVADAVRSVGPAQFGRYFDDSSYEKLTAALAAFHQVKPENILVGSGSTEIIKICDDVFLRAPAKLVVARPAYEAVVQYAANSKAATSLVALTADARHDLVKMAAATNATTGLVYICNPNNPTGTIVRRDELARFMAAIPRSVPVLVDEAYAEFVTDPAYESAIRYVREGRNVIVAKTFSKIHGLAGLRIGYAIAPKVLIDRMRPHTVDYTITGAAVAAAMASLADTGNVARVAQLNAVQRQLFVDEMKRARFTPLVSQANFVMVDIKRPVDKVIPEFTKRNVLVGRLFDAMPTHLRVTLGTDAEMKRFYPVFRQVVV